MKPASPDTISATPVCCDPAACLSQTLWPALREPLLAVLIRDPSPPCPGAQHSPNLPAPAAPWLPGPLPPLLFSLGLLFAAPHSPLPFLSMLFLQKLGLGKIVRGPTGQRRACDRASELVCGRWRPACHCLCFAPLRVSRLHVSHERCTVPRCRVGLAVWSCLPKALVYLFNLFFIHPVN